MISKKSISYKITLNRALVDACKKHKMRVSKIARGATEDALREKLERLNIKTISYMSKRAEEVALKAYPEKKITLNGPFIGGEPFECDDNISLRKAYIEGYEQAEKDLALTWEDVAYIVDTFYAVEGSVKEKCEEVLRRFNEYKKLV